MYIKQQIKKSLYKQEIKGKRQTKNTELHRQTNKITSKLTREWRNPSYRVEIEVPVLVEFIQDGRVGGGEEGVPHPLNVLVLW